MTRRTMAERKRRAADRDTRRESLLVLLSRARRTVPLTPSEGDLLFAHVTVELAEADELRRTVQGQQTALQRAFDRVAAAEAAIVEAEQRAEQAEQQLTATRSQLHDVKARRDDARAGRQDAERALDRVRNSQSLGESLAVVALFDG
ncbi:hypothetical protein ACFVAQ_45865, partial [Streptomyces sp. NPDC057651]|uniref:hypothetical protein n=1 Tax=Streptomyces sp. NPDC057651 TaxID=3346194 RepID=UPI0036808119